MNEEYHLHLATVFGPLEAVGRDLHDAGPKERNSHDLGVFEVRVRHLASDDRIGRKGNVCK